VSDRVGKHCSVGYLVECSPFVGKVVNGNIDEVAILASLKVLRVDACPCTAAIANALNHFFVTIFESKSVLGSNLDLLVLVSEPGAVPVVVCNDK